jgi:predicted NBD/HSP70 family sugar kinase
MLAVLDSRDIVALDLSAPDELRGGVYSLRGVRRTSAQAPLDGATGEAALHVLETLVADLRARAAHPVLGLGIATPGTIDASGTVMTARSFGWNDLPLRDIVAARAGVPVTVLNDANAAAVGEQAFAGGPADLLRVQLAVGVGAGLLLGGQLVIGQSAAVGEIGHLIVDYQGRKCICGRRGCLETWASIPALTRRLAAEPGRRDEILAEGGRRLGMALVPVLAMLDLDDVVLGGPPALFGGVFTRAAQDLINERLHSEFRADVRLRPSTLGDEATLLGVVAMVLRTTLGVW